MAFIITSLAGFCCDVSYADPTPKRCDRNGSTCVTGKANQFDAEGQDVSPTQGQQEVKAPSAKSGRLVLNQYAYAPTCVGNTRTDGGLLCQAAVGSCPQPNFIRYWIWRRSLLANGVVLDDWQRLLSPDSVCLGAVPPSVDKGALIAGTVNREFKSLVVEKGTVHVQPVGRTLVNFQTTFYTEATTYDLPVVTILGEVVHIVATPVRFDWYFGDGASAPGAGAGARGSTAVSHLYRLPGTVGPYVVITWSGTYRAGGGAAKDITGTAVTTSAAAPLRVEQARARLVAGEDS